MLAASPSTKPGQRIWLKPRIPLRRRPFTRSTTPLLLPLSTCLCKPGWSPGPTTVTRCLAAVVCPSAHGIIPRATWSISMPPRLLSCRRRKPAEEIGGDGRSTAEEIGGDGRSTAEEIGGDEEVDSGGDRGETKKFIFFSSSHDVAAKLASVPVSIRRVFHVDAHWTSILPCQQLGVDLINFFKGWGRSRGFRRLG